MDIWIVSGFFFFPYYKAMFLWTFLDMPFGAQREGFSPVYMNKCHISGLWGAKFLS